MLQSPTGKTVARLTNDMWDDFLAGDLVVIDGYVQGKLNIYAVCINSQGAINIVSLDKLKLESFE